MSFSNFGGVDYHKLRKPRKGFAKIKALRKSHLYKWELKQKYNASTGSSASNKLSKALRLNAFYQNLLWIYGVVFIAITAAVVSINWFNHQSFRVTEKQHHKTAELKMAVFEGFEAVNLNDYEKAIRAFQHAGSFQGFKKESERLVLGTLYLGCEEDALYCGIAAMEFDRLYCNDYSFNGKVRYILSLKKDLRERAKNYKTYSSQAIP
ncbi:MAG: hypothetical protein AAF502_01065 [Bacteroidota bacterium]